MTQGFDVAIVGGGIVGLAIAYRLSQTYPDCRLVLLEKEDQVAGHQTGHNSGVIHSGLYYRPGSAKARLCVSGGETLKAFCTEQDIPFDICGKVVVATEDREVPVLEELYRRGVANGVEGLQLIAPEALHQIEPHSSGIRALHVPTAGIIDYPQVARKLARIVDNAGGTIRTGTRLKGVRPDASGLVLLTSGEPVHTRYMISCAGLHSDRVARMEGGRPNARIVPFRGEYYELVPERCSLVRGLIYPVPDRRFPFLGVHFTRMIHGGVEAGPNAVLALSREGYGKLQVNPRDLAETLLYPGFWKLALKYWKTGAAEVYRSFSKRAFLRALQRLVPEVRDEDIHAAGSGVRAQALDPSGQLVDDFLIVERPRALHVCNAPSPAATSSLAIAGEILRKVDDVFELGTTAQAS